MPRHFNQHNDRFAPYQTNTQLKAPSKEQSNKSQKQTPSSLVARLGNHRVQLGKPKAESNHANPRTDHRKQSESRGRNLASSHSPQAPDSRNEHSKSIGDCTRKDSHQQQQQQQQQQQKQQQKQQQQQQKTPLITVVSQSVPYERISQVGQGTYGKVYKAKSIENGEIVALKRIRIDSDREGFPITSIREIRLLQALKSDFIITLKEIILSKGQYYMVFDYLDHDLTGLLAHREIEFSLSNIKYIIKGLFLGLSYIHSKNVIHRDLKGSNILISRTGRVKIADFGLARFYEPHVGNKLYKEYSNRVITLWYKPPELLLGAQYYGSEIDIWSAGCIFLELFTRKAILRGQDEIDQLNVIWSLFGTPTEQSWPQYKSYPWSLLLTPATTRPSKFNETFSPQLPPEAFQLASSLLTINPQLRLSAADALTQPFFTTDPRPRRLAFLDQIDGEWHELESKQASRHHALQSKAKP